MVYYFGVCRTQRWTITNKVEKKDGGKIKFTYNSLTISSTISRALPPISFTVYLAAVDVACITLERETGRQLLMTRFGSANNANQPVARHFNSGSHSISDMKIRALCPISGSNDSRKRQEMRLISQLGTIHPLGINKRFCFI